MTCELCGTSTSSYLCTRHADELVEALRELPDLYAEVGEHLVPSRAAWGEIVSTRSAAGPRSPVNEDVIDTVNWGRAAEVIRLWRTDVRRVRWPHRGAGPLGTLGEDCAWLVHQVDWIVTAYPAAGDLAREVWTLDTQARSVVGDPRPRRQRLGLCVAVTDDEGTVCGAVLSRLPGETVRCRWCGMEYRSEQDIILLAHHQPREVA